MDDETKQQLKEEEASFDEKFPAIHFKIRRINRITNIMVKLFILVILACITGGMVTEFSIRSKYNDMVNAVHEKISSENSITSYKNMISNIKNSIVSIGESENNLLQNSYFTNNSTGIVIDKYNKVLTSYSNIKDLETIYVKLPGSDNSIIKGELLIGDEDLDIAIIQVPMNITLVPVTLAGNKNILAGDGVILASNSTGDSYIDSIIPGIITSVNRKITIGKYEDINILELNTNINEMNKNGGIFNSNGELIGIANYKITNKIDNKGLYYAIDVELINSFVDSINKVKDYIGVIEGGFVDNSQNSTISGFYIERINRNSGAYEAGLRPTDIIYEIDNIKITSMNQMYIALDDKKKNDIITFKIFKEGKMEEIKFTIK